jgi:zinc/manganese transport system substrate-binding protein
MKKLLHPLFFLVLLLGIPAVAYSDLKVVTATTDLVAVARAVGGKLVDAESLTPGPTDPHFIEARPSMIRRVASADLMLVIGAELEIGWIGPVLQTARNSNVQPGAPGYLDLSAVVPMLDRTSGPVNRALGDVHPLGNPHYMLDPENGILVAQAIADRFKQLDPKNADEYGKNLAKFTDELRAKMPGWKKALEPLKGKSVISYHTSFRYLSQFFGFSVVGFVEPLPGIPPTASHVETLMKKIRDEKISLLLMEEFYERRSADFLSAQTGIHVVILPHAVASEPQIKTYVDLFDTIVQRLSQVKA